MRPVPPHSIIARIAPAVTRRLVAANTTFPTFALELPALIEMRAMGAATVNIVASVALSLLATLAGLWLGRLISP